VKIKDAETGNETWVDTSLARVRNGYKHWWEKRQTEMNNAFKKSHVDSISVSTDEDYVKALISLFNKRS
jgi:hypothetical protein